MKKLVTSYTFVAASRTVQSADFTSLEKIQLITNVTDQIIIYNFADTAKGGTLSSTTLTLEYDTSTMSNTDKLQIFVEDGAAVQPVSGSVTADLGANNDVTVTSGSITATQATGTNLHVVVDSAPTTAVTGTFYQATQPVSGTVTANTGLTQPLTDTQLRATAVPVSGTFYQATQPVSVASIPSHPVTNVGTFAVQATGTVTANAGTNLNTSTLALESGGNLAAIKAKTDNIPAQGQALAAASLPVVLTAAQVSTLTPPAAITGFATAANQLPDGHNVTVDNASIAVTGSFYQATQPVSAVSLPLPTGAATAANQQTDALTDTQLRATAVPVSGTFYQATQPVSLASVPSHAVTNAGTFATQATLQAGTANIGVVGHNITGIGHGVKTVTTAGTDVALAASTACKKVDIQAQTDNTSLIAVGGSGVDATIATGTGIVLNPGETYCLEIDNLADIYIDSLVSGEGVRFTYYT